MKYDFETLIDRMEQGSGKWMGMKKKKPDLSEGIVPFSVADMEFKNPPEVAEGLYSFMKDHVLGYTSPTEDYYKDVCKWMKKRHNWDVSPDSIVCTLGVVPALTNAVKAFCKPGEGVILFTPVYYPFYMAAEKNGCEVKKCPLIYKDGKYSIDFDLFEELCKDDNNTMLIFCSPHNPVGRVWTKEELNRVGTIAIENNVRVLSDEIHFDLIMPGHEHTVFPNAGDFGDKIIVCTAPSKTFNLATMQCSNIVIPNEEDRNRFREIQGFGGPGALGLQACRIVYEQCEEWLDECLEVIHGNYQYVVNYINEKLPVIKPIELQGTYLLWLDCTALGLSKEELEELMVQKAEWFTDEGYMFGEEGAGFERINLACPRWVLEKAMVRLEKAVKSM